MRAGSHPFVELPLSGADREAGRRRIESLLSEFRLNVISDERLTGFGSMCRDHEWLGIDGCLSNMREVFKNCDIAALVSLREPTAAPLSNYVQRRSKIYDSTAGSRVSLGPLSDHVERRSKTRFKIRPELSSFNSLLDDLFETGGDNRDIWLKFHYEELVRTLANVFGDARILLFEDLVYDPAHYFGQLAEYIDMDDPVELERMFMVTHENRTEITDGGLGKRKVLRKSLRFAVYEHAGWLTAPFRRFVRPSLNRLGLYASYDWLFSKSIALSSTESSYPSVEARERARDMLSLRSDYLTRVHGISEERLRRYGYYPAETEYIIPQ